MDLKKKLGSIERTEISYILIGTLMVLAAALGLQYQEKSISPGENKIDVSMTLEKPNETLTDTRNIKVNSTVFDAVNQSYELDFTEYDFGYFITSIDGLEQNRTHSWLYKVNNDSVNNAVNNYVLTEDSNITFTYTANSEY